MKQHISTADVAQGKPLDFWRSWLANKLHAVDVRDYDAENFYAECDISDAGDLSRVRFNGTRQSFIRTSSMIRQSELMNYMITIVQGSMSYFHHNDHTSVCYPGDVLLLDTGRPYEITHHSSVQVLNFIIPSHLLKAALGPTDLAAGLVLDGQNVTTQLIRNHLKDFAQHADQLDAEVARRMSLAAVDMVAAGFDEKLGQADHGRARHWMFIAKAKAFLESHLEDPDLDLTRIADSLGTRPRRLQEIFASQDTSVMDCIWTMRLRRAEKLLRNDVKKQMNIASIGYRCGFVSPAHFARRFKAHFGATPTDYRQNRSIMAEQDSEAPQT